MRALDEINATSGRNTVVIGSYTAKPKNWTMKKQFSTNAFTTRWSELPQVR
jgi:hypothetical protein